MSQSTALITLGPDRTRFAAINSLVLDSLTSCHSRHAYARALDRFSTWYSSAAHGGFTKALVQQYRTALQQQNLSASTINLQLAAIRKLAAEAADNGFIDPAIAAGIAKVRGVRQLGTRTGNWLTTEQSRQLLVAPDPATLKGKRDRAVLALLIGCGLRRSELAELVLERVVLRDRRWVIIDLAGKGGRVRTVPVPTWVKAQLDVWTAAAEIRGGRAFRAVDKAGRAWGAGLSEKAVWWIVLGYARQLGFDRLAPHDLRRTCAKLCRAAGGDLEQIQLLLGHNSIQTTERYLGSRQNLARAVNDNLSLAPEDDQREIGSGDELNARPALTETPS